MSAGKNLTNQGSKGRDILYIMYIIYIFREREREIQRQGMAVVDPSCAFMHGVPAPVPARNDALKHPRTSKCIAQGQLPILLPGM